MTIFIVFRLKPNLPLFLMHDFTISEKTRNCAPFVVLKSNYLAGSIQKYRKRHVSEKEKKQLRINRLKEDDDRHVILLVGLITL